MLRPGHQIFLTYPSLLDPGGEGIQPRHESEGWKSVVEALDESSDIRSCLYKPKRRSKADFGNNIVSHEPSNMEFSTSAVINLTCKSTYTAQGAKSNSILVFANWLLSLVIQSSILASTNGSILLILLKLYYKAPSLVRRFVVEIEPDLQDPPSIF